MLNGHVEILNGNGSGYADVNCQFVLDGSPVSPLATNAIPAGVTGQLSVDARAAAGPGSHAVGMSCFTAATTMSAQSGAATVVATG